MAAIYCFGMLSVSLLFLRHVSGASIFQQKLVMHLSQLGSGAANLERESNTTSTHLLMTDDKDYTYKEGSRK